MAKPTSKNKTTRKGQQKRAQLPSIKVDSIKQEESQDAATILEYTYKSANSLLEAFELVRKKRGASRGMTTDAEQDVLRAMLVMTAAGLDGMAKQLIRDSLPTLVVHKDEKVQNGLKEFIRRQIRGDAEGPDLVTGTKFLAEILAAESQQRQVIEEYIHALTGGSLQSAKELSKVATAFGFKLEDLGGDHSSVQAIFDTRNKIIHELDIDLSGDRRKRNLRGQRDMVENTGELLKIGLKLVQKVDNKLREVGESLATPTGGS